MDPRNQPSLLERIYSWENLLDAYHEAASEKWYRNDVTAFAANLEENLISIQNDLIWHTYKVGRYRQFYVHEPKERLVMALWASGIVSCSGRSTSRQTSTSTMV